MGNLMPMTIFRGYKVEVDVTNKQCSLLRECAGVARWAFNWGLARRIQEYKETGKSSNAIDQHRQLNVLKCAEYAWLYNYSKCIPQEALQDLDRAYQNFFRRVKQGKVPGFPKFKSRKNGIGSFRLTGQIHIKNTHIKLPRIGWVRLKEHGYIPTAGIHILSATVSESAGRWFVSVHCREELDITPATGEPVGVDLGIKELAVVSDGRRFENPMPLKRAQKQLKRLQRELSRRKKGGKNREKTRQRLACAHKRVANIRRDTLHKVTTAIVAKTKPSSERPSAIVLEDLAVAEMLRNHLFARAIMDVGFAEFRRQIGYKSAWYGSDLILADRFFPSSRVCRFCGTVNTTLKVSDRTWVCGCGAEHDRDLNAAINLRLLSVRGVPSEQPKRQTPVESVSSPMVGVGSLVEAGTKHGISC